MSSARIINSETKIMMMINMRIKYVQYCFKYLTWMNSFNLYHNPAKLNIIIPPPFFLSFGKTEAQRGLSTCIQKVWNHDIRKTLTLERQRSLAGYSPWGCRVRQDLATKQQRPDSGTWFFPKAGEGKTSGFHTQKQVAILGIKGGV